MTLLQFDGFDVGDAALRYAAGAAGGSGSTSTRFSAGRSLGISTSANLVMPVAASATLIVGLAFSTASNSVVLNFKGDTQATQHVYVSFAMDGSISVRRGTSSGTVLGSAAAGTVPNTTWNYAEVKVTISDTVGVVEIRLNGSTSPVINLTAQDTKNAGTNTTLDGVEFTTAGTTQTNIDDVYILNTSGSAPHNDFLGDVRVRTISPNGNGNYSQLTGSDGNSTDNYLLVDERPYSATDYVGGVSGLKDSYTMEDIPTGATVYALREVAIALKSDAGLASIKNLLRISGTDYTTSAVALTPSAATYLNVRTVSPATAAAFTASEVNGLEAGVETA